MKVSQSAFFLNFGRIVRAKNFFGNVSSVDHGTRAALPGKSLEVSVGICHNIFGILVLVSNFFIGDTEICYGHGVFGIYIFQCVVGFYKEEIDLVISGCVCLFQKCFIQVVLVCIVVRWCDVPYNIYITDFAVGSVNFFVSRIVVGQTGFEFFILAIDVQDFALIRSCFFGPYRCCGHAGEHRCY